MDAEQAKPDHQAGRLATLAGVARPVQHELNNLLTVIFANLEMLKRTAADGTPQRQLDRIQEAARRFELSTRAILSLIRRPVPEPAVLSLPVAIAALRPLLAVLLPAPNALVLALGPEGGPKQNGAGARVSVPPGWLVRLDRAALDEALLALVREAAGTLPRGGALTLGVADRPGEDGAADAVELQVRRPQGVALAALEELCALARCAGGTVVEEAADGTLTLCLRLPRALPGTPPPP
jgi:His Kinase A (phospho-acceptor) domain